MKIDKIDIMHRALLRSWSLESSSRWTKENPAKGQCGVTALVVNDIFGGEILKTKANEFWHYYNQIDGVAIDFTQSQFESNISYDNTASNRIEAFSDTNMSQYTYLYEAIKKFFKVLE